MKKEIKILDHIISDNSKTFIVAEMSANHNKDIVRARELVYAAKECGADAIKLQTYRPETITIDCNNDYFNLGSNSPWGDKTLYDLYEKGYTPWEWHYELMEIAHKIGLVFFSTPFDFSSLSFLTNMNVPAYKIASFEITDIPLIKKIAEIGKPIMLSTGIAELSDIELALKSCREIGNEQVILMKCCSAYPTPYEDINLETLVNMRDTFDCLVGLSDHSLGEAVAVAGVAMGAKVVEKHLTIRRDDGGVDSAFSMEPKEFRKMVDMIRIVEKAKGSVTYELSEKQKNEKRYGRSLFVIKDVKNGDIVSDDNVRSIRPSFGMHPKYLDEIIGRRFNQDIARGTPLNFKMID